MPSSACSSALRLTGSLPTVGKPGCHNTTVRARAATAEESARPRIRIDVRRDRRKKKASRAICMKTPGRSTGFAARSAQLRFIDRNLSRVISFPPNHNRAVFHVTSSCQPGANVMNNWSSIKLFAALSFFGCALATAQQPASTVGIFDTHQDIGAVLHAGAARFDAASGTYTLTGSGENMWFGRDDFHFAWKKMSGDVAISADIAFIGDKGNPHRKAVLMIRQSLDAGSPAVDIARHGNGMTSLQFRLAPGADDREVESYVTAPTRVRLEKRGDFFYAFVAGADGKLNPSGASIKLPLQGEFYIGIGVCSHDKDASETATFRNVKLETLAPSSA